MIHECHFAAPYDGYGPAVDTCYGNDAGELWVSNGEYASQVNFCPWCGFAAPVKSIDIKAKEKK